MVLIKTLKYLFGQSGQLSRSISASSWLSISGLAPPSRGWNKQLRQNCSTTSSQSSPSIRHPLSAKFLQLVLLLSLDGTTLLHKSKSSLSSCLFTLVAVTGPVTITSFLSNLSKYPYCTQDNSKLDQYLESNNKLSLEQLGFKKKLCKYSVFFNFRNSILGALDQSQCKAGVFSDLSKGIDIKLHSLGISSSAIKCFNPDFENTMKFSSTRSEYQI